MKTWPAPSVGLGLAVARLKRHPEAPTEVGLGKTRRSLEAWPGASERGSPEEVGAVRRPKVMIAASKSTRNR